MIRTLSITQAIAGGGSYYGDTTTYTATKNRYYPARWADMSTGTVNKSSTGGVLGESDVGELTTETYYHPSSSITVTTTYWYKVFSVSDFYDDIYYELLINKDGANYSYALASNYTLCGSYLGVFGMRWIYGGMLTGFNLFNGGQLDTNGGYPCEYTYEMPLRPVVELQENVGYSAYDGSDGFIYWNIMD